jgi:hypothetical protein
VNEAASTLEEKEGKPMIRIDKVQEIAGVTVYGDDELPNKFYVVPNQPRYRIDDNGFPVFKFLKYRFPVDRPNGAKGGGFLIADAEFVVPEDKLKKVQGQLEDQLRKEGTDAPVVFGVISYTKGKTAIQFLDSGGALVQKIQNPGTPSLFGHNITAFTVEMSPEGATLAEQALQGSGGAVQVIYDLNFMVRLPPMTATVWFNASKFYDFYQKIDKDNDKFLFWGSDSQTETRRETFVSTDSGGVDLEFRWTLPDADQDKKIKDSIRDWAWKTLEDAVKRMAPSDIAANTDTGLPDGEDHVTRDISSWKLSSFSRTYSESAAIEWHIVPQGTLPNITSLSDPKGKPIQWKDYSAVVDLDDPFFKQLAVNVTVNADFQALPIQSVDVHLDYHQGGTHKVGDFHLKGPDDAGKFSSFIENNVWKYKYSYIVNYKGESRTYQSPEIETERTALTIDVGDLGLLAVDVAVGDINWSQVSQAQVTLQYKDGGNTLEEELTLDKSNVRHRVEKLLSAPRTGPYQYQVKYIMADGKEFQSGSQDASSSELYVNDPFSANRTIGLRGIGNFDTDIDTVFVDLKYEDSANDYVQTKSTALTKSQSFFDWTFPVISATGGTVTYSGTIKYKNGTVEDIPAATAASDTVLVGKKIADSLEISVAPDLVDWGQVKLIKVNLHYKDDGNGLDLHKDLLLKQGVAPPTWKVDLKDKAKNSFDWQATFYMATTPPSERHTPVTTASDTMVVLEVPAA